MAKYQREKGARNEREAIKLLQEVGFAKARRKLSQYQQKSGVDIENTSNLRIQVKSGKNINLWKAFSEVANEAKGKNVPLVMAKKDRFGWFVFLRWDDFRGFLKTN